MRILGFLKYIKPYRIWVLKQMLVVVEGYIEEDWIEQAYLCHRFWGGCVPYTLPDWKQFQEVKKRISHDNPFIYGGAILTCKRAWFTGNEDRATFLIECINDETGK